MKLKSKVYADGRTGNYHCQCATCSNRFIGAKLDVVCPDCITPQTTMTPDPISDEARKCDAAKQLLDDLDAQTYAPNRFADLAIIQRHLSAYAIAYHEARSKPAEPNNAKAEFLAYLWQQFPATKGHIPLGEKIDALVAYHEAKSKELVKEIERLKKPRTEKQIIDDFTNLAEVHKARRSEKGT